MYVKFAHLESCASKCLFIEISNVIKFPTLYKPLNFKLANPIRSNTATSWNKDLQSLEALHRILAGYNTTCAFATNSFWIEQQYKKVHRAYIFLHLTQPQFPDRQHCPLYNELRPSLLHSQWTCLPISRFWNQVELVATTVTGLPPCRDVYLLLFGSLDTPLHSQPRTQIKIIQSNKPWLTTCHMAARKAMLKHCTASIPHYQRHQKRFAERKEKLNLALTHHQKALRFHRKWDLYIQSATRPGEPNSRWYTNHSCASLNSTSPPNNNTTWFLDHTRGTAVLIAPCFFLFVFQHIYMI